MKILVIGSEGNVGKVLIEYLRTQNHDVICSDIIPKLEQGYYQADINIPIDLMKVFSDEKPEIIYLLAGQVSRVLCELSGGLAINTNIAGTYNVIELCKLFNSKLIFMSSSEVYGNQNCLLDEDTTMPQPNNRYGLTKYLMEQIIRYEISNGLRAVILRPFMMYHESETRGENRSAMIRFVDSLFHRQPITIHKNSGRSWFYLEDAVRAMERAIYLNECRIINIGTDNYIETADLAMMIANKLNINLLSYAKYIDLPEKMTNRKTPKLDKMHDTLKIYPDIDLETGINRVINRIKEDQ